MIQLIILLMNFHLAFMVVLPVYMYILLYYNHYIIHMLLLYLYYIIYTMIIITIMQ